MWIIELLLASPLGSRENVAHCFQMLKRVSYRMKALVWNTLDFLLLIYGIIHLVFFLKKIYNFCCHSDTHDWDVGRGSLWCMLGLFRGHGDGNVWFRCHDPFLWFHLRFEAVAPDSYWWFEIYSIYDCIPKHDIQDNQRSEHSLWNSWIFILIQSLQ